MHPVYITAVSKATLTFSCITALRERPWTPSAGLGRVGVLVVTAQVLVGVMAVTLAAWFLMWAPDLKFREVPHYAGVPVSQCKQMSKMDEW